MKNPKVLVVEDEVKIAGLIKRVIESENYSVELAHDGRQGLVMAEKNDYDLIVLDIMLPKLNGLEVCKALRSDNVKTPIIMLTARDTIEDRLAASDAGADEYLSKPFYFEDLLEKVRALIDAKNESSEINGVRHNDLNEKKEIIRGKINQKIMDNIPVSIVTIDKEGNMVSANKYYSNFSKSKDFHGNNIFTGKFFQRENLIEDYKKLLSDGTMVKRDHLFERNDKGEDKYLKITAIPLLDKEGNIEGALSMAQDNTESVLLQKQLQLLNEELEKKVARRTAQLDAANKEIVKVLELKSMFVADVSHEMRTSLAIIQGSIELLSRGLVESCDIEDSYGQIFSEIRRMSSMLSDMSLLSESETSKMRLDLREIEMNQLIAQVCKSLKNLDSDKYIEIKHRNPKKKIFAIVDSTQIEKLVMNLVQNAIRYNKENGRVEIWAQENDGQVEINVKDSGIGIPEEYQQDIFERFYRVDKARSRNEGGSGLGLAICKWVAEVHGGKISVESILGQGSLFSVTLPRNNEKSEAVNIDIDSIIS